MKHHLKLIAVLALALVMALPSLADNNKGYSLVVYNADGTRTAYASSDHPKLTINSTVFTVTTGEAKIDYPVSNLRRFTLEDADGEVINDTYWLVISLRDGTIEAYPFTDRPKITINDGTFTVSSTAHTVSYTATNVDRFRLTDRLEGQSVNADVNGDGSVDVADIATIIDVMAGIVTDANLRSRADTNKDSSVDVADISNVIDVMASGQ